ncbi:acyl--CoA ligase [Candidatus Gracilibacteria bacterium]|nr:acyl--CoA ligase [Candidatus Gracilibacteria bacterium]NJM86156.1 acyl--CoA ligase [Hydrococcus sp. RU_2_2]NJP19142.1 acyl--CoA ligase [Hydrococcus sp. CRU_1_1]NJQ96509.1 acyl--CoA ligase [Hydrococcus sp. CSU_1_8]
MLTQLLAKAVSNNPEKTAIVCDNIRMSYQDLARKVEGFSRGLNSIGVGQGDCVALLLPNCPEFVIGFYAIAKLNGIVLPLNHLFKIEEIGYYLADSDVKVIITDSKRADLCLQALSNFDRAIQLIVVDKIHSPAKYFYDLILPEKTEGETAFPTSDDVLYQYSSGSTGRPKRVARTQKNLYNEAISFAETAKVNSSDNILCVVPLYHAHGLGNCLLASICNGATLVILEQSMQNGISVEVPFIFKVPRILDLIETEKITILPGVPYIFKAMAESPTSERANLSTVRLCFSAGNFLGKDVFEKFLKRFSVPIRQLYGCTEAGAVGINLDENPEATWNSVGIPLKNVEIEIIGEHGDELAVGAIGEVVIKSPTLTNGYYNLPELNQQAFKDGAFFTGDLGKFDSAGRLYITGRKKILIDTGGRKVDPIEIEDILVTHPKVKEAVVVGVKEVHSGEIVKAVIVPNGPESFREQEIFSYCQERLAEFKVPKIVEFRDEIPKSPLGKILRKHLV